MRIVSVLRQTAVAAVSIVGLSVSATAQPALWHMSDEDSDVYIFGTIHILPADLEWRSAEIDAAFASAQTVYFETPSDAEAQAAMQPLIVQLGLNHDGRSLSSMLDDETNERLQRIAPSVGLPVAQLEIFRPWLAGLSVSVGYLMSQGQDPNSGVEQVLAAEAAAAGQTVAFFETPEQQLHFFADMSEDVQVNFLAQGLVDIESGEALSVLEQMDESWVSGDIDGLDELVNGGMKTEMPEVYQTIFVNRNNNWVLQIEEILDGSGTVFIAVGAGHLAGEDSVITQLRSRGYDIVGP
jgi:uncharacterized protein YbaP (TraB family)